METGLNVSQTMSSTPTPSWIRCEASIRWQRRCRRRRRVVGRDRNCDDAMRENAHGGRKSADRTPRRRLGAVVDVERVTGRVAAEHDAFGGHASHVTGALQRTRVQPTTRYVHRTVLHSPTEEVPTDAELVPAHPTHLHNPSH